MFRLVATNNNDIDNFYMYLALATLMLFMMIVAAVYYHFKNKK